MITIITGKRNGGKTTTLQNILKATPKKWSGFISLTNIDKSKYFLQDVENLEQNLLMEDSLSPNWKDRFFIFYETFDWANHKILTSKNLFFMLDEIGLLEIDDKRGFFPSVEFLIAKDDKKRQNIFTVRKSFLDKFYTAFKLNPDNCRVIDL